MEANKQVTCLCVVARRKQKEEIVLMLQNTGINLINITYGKGIVKAGFLQNMLGLVPEENKIVIFCMTTVAKADVVLKTLVDSFRFDEPNTGIAFTIPIEAVSY